MKRCLKRMPTECVENKILSMPDDSGMLFLFAPNRGTIEERRERQYPRTEYEGGLRMSIREISFPSNNGRDTVKAWAYTPLGQPRGGL